MAETTVFGTIKFLRGTTAEWVVKGAYVPKDGEPCLDTTTGLVKYGDGTTTYANLPNAVKQATHYEGTTQSGESDSDVIARVLTGVTAEKDDVFIVKTLIADDKYSMTAYHYTGEAWAAMDGNYNAENVYFDSDLVITAPIGVQTISSTGSATLDTTGKNMKQVLDMLVAEELQPTTTLPTVTISASVMKAYEVGSSVTPTYDCTLNAGSYTYGPATGITATAWVVSNNVDAQTRTTEDGTFDALTVGDSTSYRITAVATYGDGAMPVTNLGNDAPDVQISGSTASKSTAYITGYRNSFYGTATSKSGTVDSDAVRTLTGKSAKALANGGTFTITVPVGAMRVVFAYPATLQDVSSVKDVNGLNAEINTAFTKTLVDVEGASEYSAISYKVYIYDLAAANDVANTFTVTI